MANRRMFSQRIVGDESFLEMPVSAQNLYFHLGIYADDDGFVNPQKVIRMIGCNPDDLKIVITKEFVIPFKNGVVVITNWKENNYIQADRYTPTIYQEQFKQLGCIQNVYKLDTQVRLGKDRLELGKVKIESKELSKVSYSEFNNVKLTDEEKTKLVNMFGEKNTNLLIEELGTYMASQNKRYASHYATLLNWGKRKINDYQQKKNTPSKYQAGSINISTK